MFQGELISIYIESFMKLWFYFSPASTQITVDVDATRYVFSAIVDVLRMNKLMGKTVIFFFYKLILLGYVGNKDAAEPHQYLADPLDPNVADCALTVKPRCLKNLFLGDLDS